MTTPRSIEGDPCLHRVARGWLDRLRALRQNLVNELFDEEGLATIFQHARNLLTSAMLLAAGLYAAHHVEQPLPPGMWTVHLAGYGVSALGAVLMLLNLFDGLRRLARRQHSAWLRWPVIVFYVAMTLRLTQVLVYFRTAW